jgi:putative transposase
MPQSLARIWLHIVFSTSERRAYLQNADLCEEMFRMLGHHAKDA